MKVDLDAPLKVFGQATKVGDADLTVKEVAKMSLNFTDQGTSRSVDGFMKQYRLGQKIDKGGVQDLDSEEVGLIKAGAVKIMQPFAFGSLVDLLEGREDGDQGKITVKDYRADGDHSLERQQEKASKKR